MSIRQHLPLIARVLIAAVLGLACGPAAPPAAPSTAAPDPAARADDAAMYALPLVIMDVTREQFFADPIAADATPNRFLHIPILGNPSFRAVVRPNVDTLYSTAWLDLSTEPVVMTLPPADGRYYVVQCMDAWTNVFAAPGIRTLGDKGARYAIVGPDWHGPLPAHVEVVRAPTPMVWVLGRVYVRDAADLSAARKFQRQIDVRPVSRVGDAAFDGVYPHPRPPGAARRIMRELLHEMTAEAFFERFTRLTAANPPSPPDPKIVAEVLAPLGIAPGRAVTWASLDEGRRAALAGGLERTLRTLEDRRQIDEQRPVTQTGWSSMAARPARTEPTSEASGRAEHDALGDRTRYGLPAQGNYGTSYRVRAAVAVIGLGANLRADAIYMNASVDANRQPLDGSKRYRLTFAKDQAPPVRAFWSVTLYDEQGYLIANPAERYAIKSGDDLAREPDGSLAIYLSPEDPGPVHHASWLPTPANRRFELSLRAYWPGEALLDERWQPPAVAPE